MKMSERDRRDWSLLIFIVPFGILLMLITGQFAMRIIPQWILNAGMGSNLKVETAGGQQTVLHPLFNIQILTPFSWQNTYLTPNADSGFVFPPFVVLEPSATPTPTEARPTETATPPPATVSPSATTPVSTVTPPPTEVVTTPPVTSPATCQDSNASNFGGPLPCTYPPTTCQDPAATNFGGPLPCTYPPTTCQDSAATNFGGPLPCTYPPTSGGVTSTPDPSYTLVTPAPADLGVGTPPDDNIGNITDGQYVVIGLSIVVGPTPDNNYDLVLYEYNNGGSIYLDWIIVGISNSPTGSEYYEVFNWGNNIPDANTNVDTNELVADPNCPSGEECDDREIPESDLYPNPGAGILIDVDTATSAPPAGTYDYIVVISPNGGPANGDAQVDSIEVTEVPIPTPPP
ncbi:MAG: hypothetical protein IH589_10700 [Anaerolineales bacterium]|nr:hypothetical protein [Anaerolineales bacterium]